MTTTGNEFSKNNNELERTLPTSKGVGGGFLGELEEMLWIPRTGSSAGLLRNKTQG